MLYYLDLFGIAVFATSGAIAASRARLDLFGVVVVAGVTAVGGGSLRDLLLGAQPVFWIVDTTYLIVAAAAAVATFIYSPRGEVPIGTLRVADALGLAVFTILGAAKAQSFDAPALVVIMMGAMSGVAGGVIRDLLCGDVPLVLRQEVYATASLFGGALYVILDALAIPPPWPALVGMGLVLVIRLASLYWHWSLPIIERLTKRD